MLNYLTKVLFVCYSYIVSCKWHIHLFTKTKTKMHKLGKMVVSDKFYKEILKETNNELKELNCEMLVNWEEDTI
jgi:hypothetical protein